MPDIEWIVEPEMREEYRTAHMKIGNSWFSERASERLVALTHEVIHTHLQALENAFQALIDACDPGEPLAKWAKEQWRLAEEQAVSDLSRTLCRG